MNGTSTRKVGCFLSMTLVSPLWTWSAVPEKDSEARRLKLADVFELEYTVDPQISPDGENVVYVRSFMDKMTDTQRSNLWMLRSDGSDHRALTSGLRNDTSPRWSPDGKRLAYVSAEEGSAQIYVRWMDTGQTAQLTHLTEAPRDLSWSPDGRWIAFILFVPSSTQPFVDLPAKPEGAKWAAPPRVIRKLEYRADGRGYLEDGYSHLFVLPAEGGTPRQLTSGPFHHRGRPVWTPDGKALLVAANRHDDAEYDPLNTEIYEVKVADGGIRALTDRQGPDQGPAVSPDGQKIAYLGFDDREQGYQVTQLYLMSRDGSGSKPLLEDLDRDVESPVWSSDGTGIYFQYDDHGDTKIAFATLAWKVETRVEDVGGTSLGRPYSGGSFSVARNGRIAYTASRPDRPADVAIAGNGSSEARTITASNEDLLGHKELGAIEEIGYPSSSDGRKIQGWILKPPGFDANKRYPLILEIHGGPFANYGDRFSAEMQLYAAAGYVVFYANPRGSTSYGEAFGNLIHHNYPGQDYDDLMSGVDAAVSRGYVDGNNLFVTGGSGGGILTSWIVGKTDRFRAAVVAKPVINWYSFVLTSDMTAFFYKYWFTGFPWEHPQEYLDRSPLSLVGNVRTPTMLMTGEVDYRTPISESEQFYEALKLRGVDTMLVRIPEASHDIAARPSQLIAKVTYILKWFETHRARPGTN